jgi:aquaporin Z
MSFHWREYVCEFFGTAVLLFVGLTGVYLVQPWQVPEWLKCLTIGLFFATAFVAVSYSPLGKISGAHLNPAITFAFWNCGLMTSLDAFLYIMAQLAGAVLGSALVFQALSWSGTLYAMTLPGQQYPVFLTLVVETVLSFIMIIETFYFMFSNETRRLTALAVGLFVALATCLFAPISGASLNPARSFGPDVYMLQFSSLWIYFVGPLLGSFVAVRVTRALAPDVLPRCSKMGHRNYADRVLKCRGEREAADNG